VSAGHTPGPWQVCVDAPSGIGRTRAVYVCNNQDWPEGQLARVNVMDGFGEREANACLIAAAPDLLAELIAAVEIMDDQLCGDFPESLAAMRAAIAKATRP
jgi:hypothetical protein